MAEGVKRKISAILSADVVGYSKLMESDEEATVRTLGSYRRTVFSLVEQHNGRVIDSPGDNLLSEFGSVVDAVQCAVEVQHIIRAKNAVLPEHRRMEFRVGINLGDVIEEGDRVYGEGINIASRVEGLADPGGICISRTAYDQIVSKLALGYEDLGEYSVKNISRPIHVFRIPIDGQSGSEATKDPADSLSEKPSIAVLPFDNMSTDPEQEYFVDGMTEDIITKLSMNSMLTVIARNSTFYYKGQPKKIAQIGKELGARYVVQGSVRRAGNMMRITAQMIDSTTEGHLWANTYDREYSDIFALQDEMAQHIASALNVKYTEAELNRFIRIPTESLTAYGLVLRGMEQMSATDEKESRRQAKEMYERAIELDPGYAMAYSALGLWYQGEYILQTAGSEALELGSEALRKAIALDDIVPYGHATLANMYRFKEQYDLSLAEAERAISVNPNDSWAYVVICSINNSIGEPQQALSAIQKAMQLNPHYDDGYLVSERYSVCS